MKLTCAVLALALLLPHRAPKVASSEDAARRAFTLDGWILDQADGRPVAGAEVLLLATEVSTTTDGSGAFSFGSRSIAGPDDLIISYPGYRSVRVELGNLPAGPWTLRISMAREVETVGGARPDEDAG